jgi:CheY-like chemotaxis protein
VLLPAVSGAQAPVAEPRAAALARGSETILFVEDEPTVRQAGVAVLRRLGYSVIEARNAKEALAIAGTQSPDIQLVISDVIMPGMDGPSLVEQLRLRAPRIASLLMSGYTGDVLLQRGGLPADQPFLEKPFSAAALGAKVREVLDTQRR